MSKTSWSDIHPGMRAAIIGLAAAEGALKIAALADLAKRPANQVHGKKWQWAAAIALVNAFGAAPLSYFACHGKLECPLCKGGACKCGCCPGHKG